MNKYIVHDVLEAYVKDEENSKEYFFGITTGSNVTKNVTQELLRGGIGNKTYGVLRSDDGMEFSITTGLHYKDIYEIQTGNVFEDASTATDLTIYEIEEASDGTITATEKTITAGEVLDFDVEKLPKNMHVQLHTIAFDKDTNEVVADLYYIFPKASPDGNLSEEFGAATNQTQEIRFTPLIPTGSTSYGKYIIIPREQTDPEETDPEEDDSGE